MDPIAFFADKSDFDLFNVDEVEIPELTEADLPGGKRKGVTCETCGELVHDGRHVERDGHILCKKCAGEKVYYREIRRLTPEEVSAGVPRA